MSFLKRYIGMVIKTYPCIEHYDGALQLQYSKKYKIYKLLFIDAFQNTQRHLTYLITNSIKEVNYNKHQYNCRITMNQHKLI